MDEQRKLSQEGQEIDESYYDEMLLKAGKFCLFKPRLEKYLENEFKDGDLLRAASICERLDRKEEAKKYKSLEQLTA